MPSNDPQRWARVPPGKAWKWPGLPTEWTRVLERHPSPQGLANDGYPLEGYVWLDTPGKVLHAIAGQLEITDDPRRS